MKSPKAVSRRGALTGIGTLAGAALLVDRATVTTALAKSPLGQPYAKHSLARASSNFASLGSPLKEGWTYRYVSYMDFIPLDFSGGRTPGGSSMAFVYSSGLLRATVDLPPGAQIGDFELYCDNILPDGFNAVVYFSLWYPGSYYLADIMHLDIPGGGGLVVNKAVPAGASGPYPPGTKLVIEIKKTYSSFGVGGARIGFKSGAASTVLLPNPARVYDSRSSSPLRAGRLRKVALSSQLPIGAVGAVLSVTAVGTHGKSGLSVRRKSGARPVTVLQWKTTGEVVTGTVITAVSIGRSVAFGLTGRSGATNIIVDLVGYLV